jgi:hypothetical protein
MSMPQWEEPQLPPPKSGSGMKIVLIILLVLLVLFAIACGGCVYGIYYVATNAKAIAANAVRDALIQSIQESDLRPEDKTAIVAQLNRVTDEFKAGRITVEDLGTIMTNLAESPLITLGMVYLIEEKYIKPSGLSQEEKDEARLTLQRAARGVFEKKISQQDLENISDQVSTRDAEGNRNLKEKISDEELRTFLADLKRLADDAAIPEEPYEVNVGAEFKKAVDQALMKK